MSMIFAPKQWFWIIAGDKTRAWSSELATYVPQWPEDQVTRIATEADLTEVLTPLGLCGPDLAKSKIAAKFRVSAKAEAARGKIVTLGSGKSMAYQQVAQEALRYQATNGAGDYPFLQARVASGRYPDLAAAAAGTVAIENQWATQGAAIDEIEDRAKLQIDAAETVSAVLAAEQVTFP